MADTEDIDQNREYSTYKKIFERIDAAIQFSQSHGFLPIFSFDARYKNNPSAKKFMVIGYQEFWNLYLTMDATRRNFYEIIVPELPCHMYIDSEVKYALNPQFDAAQIEQRFFDYMRTLMVELEIISSKKEQEEFQVLTLNSSNEKKFSKHYLIRIPKRMFRNNYHIGAFMRRLEARILEKEGPQEKNPFYFMDQTLSGAKVLKLYADLTVYTTNRNFRIYASSKADGGYRPLLLEGEDSKKIIEQPNTIQKSSFFSTLIQYVPTRDKPISLLSCMELDGSQPISTSKTTNVSTDPVHKKRKLDKDRVLEPSLHPVHYSIPEALQKLLPRIKAEMEAEWKESLQLVAKSYDREYESIHLDSRSHACRMKREGLNDPNATHKNHIYFQVYLKRGSFVQYCYSDNDTCYRDTVEQKKIKKHTQECKFSGPLRSEMAQYLTRIHPSQALSLEKTIVQIYEHILFIPPSERV